VGLVTELFEQLEARMIGTNFDGRKTILGREN
jgi:hypothetical protein